MTIIFSHIYQDLPHPHCNTFCFPSSIDVTEVQIFIIVMYLLAAVGGAAFWQSLVSRLSEMMPFMWEYPL